jgi:hypothetical protein
LEHSIEELESTINVFVDQNEIVKLMEEAHQQREEFFAKVL